MEASGWESPCEGADYLLPPGPNGVVCLAREPAAGVGLDLLRAAQRQRRPGDRVATVGQRDQRPALVASRAQVLVHPDAIHLLWIRSLAVALVVPGARAEHRVAHAGLPFEREGADRARLPALHHVAHPLRDLA